MCECGGFVTPTVIHKCSRLDCNCYDHVDNRTAMIYIGKVVNKKSVKKHYPMYLNLN